MGYVLHILLALAVFVAADGGAALSTARPLWMLVLVALPYGLAWSSRRLFLSGRFRLGHSLEQLVSLSALVSLGAALLLCGWGAQVERWLGTVGGLEDWPGPGLVVQLAPFVVFELLAIDARVRLFAPDAHAMRQARSFQARLFAAALLPFALYLGVALLVGLSEPLRVHVEEVELASALFTGLLLACFVLVMPRLLRHTWETAPLERGPLRELLEAVARRSGFRCRELLVWNTHAMMSNAAIVGFTPGSRVVLFTDALLAELGPREIAAVFAHEIGHARRHHVFVFGAFTAAVFLGGDFLLRDVEIESEWVAAFVLFALLGLWYLLFGFLSRRFELDADLASAETLGDVAPIADALEAVCGAHARKKSSWRHFSTAQRVAFLRRHSADPRVGARLRRTLRSVSVASLLLLVAAGSWKIHDLVASVDQGRIVAELRLGRYDEAAARLAEGAEVEARVSELVLRAASLSPSERSPEVLERRARGLLASGDAQAAYDCFELAILRGRTDLESELHALEARFSEAE